MRHHAVSAVTMAVSHRAAHCKQLRFTSKQPQKPQQRWRKCDRQSDLLQHFLRRFKNFILGDRPLLAGFTLTKKPKKKKNPEGATEGRDKRDGRRRPRSCRRLLKWPPAAPPPWQKERKKEKGRKKEHGSTPALVAMGFQLSPNYDVRGAGVLSNCYKETC